MLDHITQSAAFVHRLAPVALTVKIELESKRPAEPALQQVHARRGYQQMGAGNNIRQNKFGSEIRIFQEHLD